MPRRLSLAALVALAAAVAALTAWQCRPGREAREVVLTVSPTPTPAAAAQPPVRFPSPVASARRSRFGVGVVDGDPDQVRALGLEWHTQCCKPDFIPPEGTRAPRFIPINPPLDEAMVRSLAQRFPGSHWLIGNEPNVAESSPPGLGNTDPDVYAQSLHFYAGVFRQADPTAKLVGPSVLNWTFVCNGCPGFPQGFGWTQRMRDAHVARYGAEPPLDVWSLHTYDIDWGKLPNGDAGRTIAQIQGMRDWLDGISGLQGKPIWITEMGIHWGYPGLTWRGDVAHPAGEFAYDHVERYMRTVFGWLNSVAESLHIEKWFIYPLSTTIFEQYQAKWAGITLMNGPGADAPITRLGRVYQELAGVR